MSTESIIQELGFKSATDLWLTEILLYICFIIVCYVFIKFLLLFKELEKKREKQRRKGGYHTAVDADGNEQETRDFMEYGKYLPIMSVACAIINITSIAFNHTLIISKVVTRNCIMSRLPVISVLFQRWALYASFSYRLYIIFNQSMK
eukprot:245326_1